MQLKSRMEYTKLPFPSRTPFRMNTQLILESATDLIESGIFYTGDGIYPQGGPDGYVEQVKRTLENKYTGCGERLINSCLEEGIVFPVLFIRAAPGSPYFRSVNGHHRLSIAWKHNLSFPAVFGEDYDDVWHLDPSYAQVKMWSKDNEYY